jgi:hypothetical protein
LTLFTHVGIIQLPLNQFIKTSLTWNNSTMAKMASGINVSFGQWHSYHMGAFLYPLERHHASFIDCQVV